MGKEKKEIWKLLELLNEYEPYIASDGEHRDNLWGYAYQWHSAIFPKELAESYIVSARYGFIKWLVENDKIDTKELPYLWEYWMGVDIPTDSIIMLLSISSSPIKDLISYLK